MSLMMSLAIIGALAAFVVLAANPGGIQAHGGDDHAAACAAMDEDGAGTARRPRPCLGDRMSFVTKAMTTAILWLAILWLREHASAPGNFDIEALDNGGRLTWEAPDMVADNAAVVGYMIDRMVYLQDSNNPIWQNTGDAMFMVENVTAYRELGLSYGTTYTYMVQAIVEYSDGTKGYGDWSAAETIITANAGGRLMALLDPPSAATIKASEGIVGKCADQITVMWNIPAYAGTAPATDGNGRYVGPDYIGADGAGREEVGQPATIANYMVERRAYMTGATEMGTWQSLGATTETMVVDTNVVYGMTYEYRIRPMNSAGLYGPISVARLSLSEPAEPLQPTGLVVQATGPNTVELEWQAPADPEDLWRTMADFNRLGEESARLTYVVERQVLDTNGQVLEDWDPKRTQPHKYADEFEDNRTQAWKDADAPAGLVNYRVSALVDDCNRSPAHQKNAVVVLAAPIEFAGSVAAVSASGDATITWSPADNATSQVVIAVNPTDDTDYCLNVKNSSADSHTCTGLTAGTTYVILVIALHGQGSYTLGNVVTHTLN